MSPAPTDGRNARRDRNRVAVLDAVIALFVEGEVAPSPQTVADRSGVSLRSVYRYYDDGDSLIRAAIARSFERNVGWFEVDALGEGPLDERIVRLVDRRLELHDRLAPMARVAVLRAPASEPIRDQLAERRQLLAAQDEAMFAPELAALEPPERRELVLAIGLAVGFEAFEQLRHVHACSLATARAVAIRSLTALLVAPSVP